MGNFVGEPALLWVRPAGLPDYTWLFTFAWGFLMSLRSPPAQFASILAGYLRLLQSERTLLKTEFQAATSRLIRGVIFLLVGAIFFLIALILVVTAAVSVLVENGWPAHWADLCVALSVCVFGLVSVLIARSTLQRFTLIPHRTFSQLRKDFRFAKDGLGWNRH
jgi:hypothetical protein